MQNGFFKRWWQGIKDSTPRQQLSAKMVGEIGAITGIIIGWSFMVSTGLWYFSVLMASLVLINFVSLLGTLKQRENATELEKEININMEVPKTWNKEQPNK